MPEPLWRPTQARAEASAMEAFRRAAEARFALRLPDYDALHAWSVASPGDFWAFLAEFVRLPLSGEVVSVRSGEPMPRTRWFEGAQLNYARALLYPPELNDADQPAVVGVVEDGASTSLSYRELRGVVAAAQRSLTSLGVGRGDAVAAFAANLPETVALLLACAGLGALFTSCSPDFGADAAAARFTQVAPKVLFVTTGYGYGGRWFDTTATAAALTRALAGAAVATVALPYPGVATGARGGERAVAKGADQPSHEPHFLAWDEFLALGAPAPAARPAEPMPAGSPQAEPAGSPPADPPEPVLVDLPFDHPLYVLFSSGTTGPPKAMVHRAGGALLTHAKEHLLHCDVRPGDTVFYFTTCGWMMWNWLVSALARAATLVLYDGSPSYPALERPFELVERHGVTLFGTSARYLHSLKAAGSRPAESFDLGALKTIASTGSPLSPAGFEYVYGAVKRDVHLASISGGTDIVGCFMLGVPSLPVYAGEIQRPGLGVDLAVLDEEGREVVGVPGELVCRQPLPSMPLAFLGDRDFERYWASYFTRYPGLWRHGDLVERTANGGIVAHGRSDATLNPGGVRIGTAELYRALEAVPAVVEAAAVARRDGADEEIWLLVVLSEGARLDDALVADIRRTIRLAASPRHMPARILAVSSLPRTRSGKPMELAVARLVNAQGVPNAEVVANPESLEAVRAAVAVALAGAGDAAHPGEAGARP